MRPDRLIVQAVPHVASVGWFEVRVDGPKPGGGKGRHHYRLFCLLD